MRNEKIYKTKYGTFYDNINDDDIKYFEMTDEEFDERANRLANKTLNGIRDKEIIVADERIYRNKLLFYGEEVALAWKKEMTEIFNY